MKVSVARRWSRWWLISGCVCLSTLSIGCDVETETLQSLGQSISQASASSATLTDRDNAATDFEDRPFDPPYPDRTNPFAFPTVGPTDLAAPVALPSVNEIEVLGFANVDQPRVFLRTRTTTQSLAAGDKIDGIEVVSITPPTVELRTGTLTWNAALFDHKQLRAD